MSNCLFPRIRRLDLILQAITICFSLRAAPLITYIGQTKTKKLCSQTKYLRGLGSAKYEGRQKSFGLVCSLFFFL